MYLYFSIGNGQPSEPALCQLYRHTFVPYLLLSAAALSALASISRYFVSAPQGTSKLASCRCCCRSTGQTDGRPTVV